MTRGEALMKAHAAVPDWPTARSIVHVLAALGLIRFDETEEVVNAARRLAAGADENELHRALDARGYAAANIIGALKACGYRAVKQ